MPEPNIVGFSRNYWTRGGAPPPPQGGRPGPSTKQPLEQAIANLSHAPNNATKRARYIELRRKYNTNTTGLARLMPVKGYNLFNVQGNPVVKKTTTANLAAQYAAPPDEPEDLVEPAIDAPDAASIFDAYLTAIGGAERVGCEGDDDGGGAGAPGGTL